MKDRLAYTPSSRIISSLLLFLLYFSVCNTSPAQGWSFAPSLVQSDCGNSSYVTSANTLLSSFSTSVRLSTKTQCESLRSQLNGVSFEGQWTEGYPPVIHYCKISIACTPCSGSDIVVPGQVNPGDVSFDGESTGTPFFTSHQSEAFEDWARDYKQLLESYGITSILGDKFANWQVPQTGSKDFDTLYRHQADNFNPPEPVHTEPVMDASVVDLRGKKGVVNLLRDEEDQKKQEEYEQHLKDQGYSGLLPLSAGEGIVEPTEGDNWNLQNTQHLLFVGAGVVATAAILLAASPEVATVGIVAALGEEVGAATVVSWSLPVLEESAKAIEDCASGNCPTTTQILTNMGVGEISNVVGSTGEILGGYASVATQKAIGTISTQGVNSVKYVWNAVFGTSDGIVQTWGAMNPEKHK
jgi:hypothetical protein